jgi:hypothetical protein
METEQIIFIIIALALTIFSMYKKAKKQKQNQPVPKEEESYPIFLDETDSLKEFDPAFFYQQNDVDMQENQIFSSKKAKKRPIVQNIEKKCFSNETLKNNFQSPDLEEETELLGAFEGSDLQKAFLYSEVFKNVKN